MGDFCLDCPDRPTCKKLCKALRSHLAHTCRAKSSVHAATVADIDNIVGMGMDKGRKGVRAIW